MLPVVLAAAAVVLAFLVWVLSSASRLDAIPGPKGLPLLGNALQLPKDKAHQQFYQWAKEYGGIYKIKLFTEEVVILSGFKNIHRGLMPTANFNLGGREIVFRFKAWGECGVAFSDYSSEWKARRKIFHSYYTQAVTRSGQLETVMHAANEELINRLNRYNGKPVDAHYEIYSWLINIMSAMVVGDTIDEKHHKNIATTVNSGVDALGSTVSGLLLDAYPFLRHFGNAAYNDIKAANNMKDRLIESWEQQNLTTGFIHHLNTLDHAEHVKSGTDDKSARNTLIWESFVGGLHTSASSVANLVNTLSHLPDIQQRLQCEISNAVGESRRPKISDRDKLPLHQATILELNRFLTVAPVAVPHKAVKDIAIDDVVIPANTKVIIDLWGLHHDEDFWSEPYKFNPDRFLDDSGQVVGPDHPNRTHLMAFSAGTRMCPAEAFALSEMLLILAFMTQSFTIFPETTISEQPSMDPRDLKLGIVLRPLDFKVRFQQR